MRVVFANLFSNTRKSKRDILEGDLIFFDTEAKVQYLTEKMQHHTFRFGFFVSPRREFFSFNKQEFVEEIIREIDSLEKPIIIGHNINYDLGITNLLDVLYEKYAFIAGSIERGSTYYIFRDGDKRILLFDSYNLLPMPLADIVKKMQVGEKVAVEDWENADDELIKERGRVDVILLKKAFENFINKLRSIGIRVQYTLSLTSMEYLLSNLKKEKIYLYVDYNKSPNQLLDELISFRGGRVEAFRIGEIKNVYKLDVNSMYPFVMKSYKYPIRLKEVINNVDINHLREIIKTNTVVADVEWRCNLPSKAHIGVIFKGKLVFPTGHHRWILTTPEVQYLLENDMIEKVHRAYVYESEKIFEKVIDKLYSLRLEYKKAKDDVGTLVVKLLMNSLYGRFGYQQSVMVQKHKVNEPLQDFFVEKNLGNGLYFLTNESFLVNRGFPAIAAHVTAYARMYLAHLIDTAKKREVYYVDTDSLFVSPEGYNELKKYVDDYKLGALKLEGIYDRAEIRGLKNYVLQNDKETIVKMKGIRKTATKIDENTFEQEKFYSLPASRKLVREGIIVEKIIKRNKNLYEKGVVQETGEVIPLYLETDWRDTETLVLRLEKGHIDEKINFLLELLLQ